MSDIKSYLPEFDDFTLFRKEYNRIKQIKNTKHIPYFEFAELYFIEFIYQYYLHHDIDFLKRNASKIKNIEYREIVKNYIDRAIEYKEQFMSMLNSKLADIGELDYFDTFSQYYPINGYTLKEFVLKNKDIDDTRDFTKMVSIALRLMVNPDNEENEENQYEQDKQLVKNIQEIIEILDYKQKHSFVINFKKDFIKFEKGSTSIFDVYNN